MRFVVSSDWHADRDTLGVSRFDEIRRAIEQSVQYAIDQKVDAYMFLGDLTDPDSGSGTILAQSLLIEVATRLERKGIQFLGISGNHDHCNDTSGVTTLRPLAAVAGSFRRIHVVEAPRTIPISEGLVVVCLPYVPRTQVSEDMEVVTKALWPKTGRVIVVSHLSVPGIIPGEETTEMPRGADVTYPFAATRDAILRLQGHYHRRQKFDPGDGGPPLRIIGTPSRLTFGEESHEPGFLDIIIPDAT